MMKNITLLYENDELVIFEKPSGVLVTPAPGKEKKVLTDIVNIQYGEGRLKLYPCHRLDCMTSGAIIYAKGKKHQQSIRELFQKGAVEKKYITFVKGRLKESSDVVRSGIQDYHQKKFARNSRPKMAVTKYEVLRYGKGFSVLEVQPVTGRTNQIRIQFAEMGHPVLGERVYAFRKDFDVDMKRLALHAHQLKFKNPVTGKVVEVVSDLPEDMEKFLQKHT